MTNPTLITRLDSRATDFMQQLDSRLGFEMEEDLLHTNQVRSLIEQVRREGDAALLALTQRFDRHPAQTMAALELDCGRLDAQLQNLPAAGVAALQHAAQRIRAFHALQRQPSWRIEDEAGFTLGQEVRPLDRVGVYVPGGRAAYPSSVLMNVIPAKVAGVGEIIMVSPTPDGTLNPWVLAAAAIAGVDRLFTIGGAQAVAALAYGTASVPRVDKIVGPGNRYVATAKRLLYGQVGIDMIAGPSEVLILCDGKTPAEWVVMDLFAQAEHDEEAQSILICPDAAYLDRVTDTMARLLPAQPRAAIIAAALQKRGLLLQVTDLQQGVELINHIAPEHLELSVADPEALLPSIRHAGAIFLGRHACESLGDYC
ncbi:MAG TPA: histidinol dehydrogenase, partial [Pseudomonadales bacterium]|nr:histidinol dehydrogenase [Pseudomonadales bacterium]